jgi:2-polyprenyl-3-methyl-5-hydroxy-6-metoxy-1,4-benzoquinol methylase
MSPDIRLTAYPALSQLAAGVVAAWPAHKDFLEKRLGDGSPEHLAFCEAVATKILLLVDDLPQACADYRWGGELLFKEEVHFRRTGRYRRQTAREVAELYSDRAFMKRYFNGLLLSQVLWPNHAGVLLLFAHEFLPGNEAGYSHLEVGPGHGLMLHYVASDERCGRAAAWEASAEGVAVTRACLSRLGVLRAIEVSQRDVTLAAGAGESSRFTSVGISEVLEHLEAPVIALRLLRETMAPGGRLFVNVPVNSPAPDHLYLFHEPAEIAALVTEAGFRVLWTRELPMQGFTLARALQRAVAISCVVVAERIE